MKELSVRRILLGLLLAALPAMAHAQMLGSSLISTSAGGGVSGTYGYFKYVSATSFNASTISTSIISVTAVQIVSQSSGPVTCNSGNSGTLRYNSPTTSLELCTGAGWQTMGVGIPAGTISAFASTTCPTGWSEYTAARGRFLRGIDNGAGNDPDGTRAPGATQADMLKSHTHGVGFGAGQFMYQIAGGGGAFGGGSGMGTIANTDANGGAETRPKNVAVTFCQFNGTSNGWNNPLSGGSTLAAGNTTEVQYNGGSGAFGSSSNFTYSNATGLLTAPNISTTNISVSTINGIPYTGSASGDRITSGSLVAVANSGTGYISLTTGVTNWGYLSSGVNYLPKLKTDVLSATTAIQVGSNSLTCGTSISGTMRYSAISSTMEYCNGSAWTSMGPSATQPITFLVNKNGTDQTITAGVITTLTWPNEVYDTNNNFSGNKFTPTVPGKYLVFLDIYCKAATGCEAAIYKNGTAIAASYIPGSGDNNPFVSTIIDMNGTTDYLEGDGYITGSTTIGGASFLTYFGGALLSPQGGSSGSAPAGSTNDVQYNSGGALAADTGNFTYASGLLLAPSVSATNISGTVATINSLGAGNVNASGIVTAAGISATSNLTSVTTLYASGRVGIGTTNPSGGKLQVATTDTTTAIYAATTGNAYSIFASAADGSQGVAIRGDNSGTGSQGALGYVAYGVFCKAGTCGGANAWSVASDARLKERVQNLPGSWGLAAIEKLRPVTYHWRDAKRDRKEGEQIGFIAQDVKTVFPNLVLADKGSSTTITLADGKTATVQDPMSLKYELLVAPLVKAVQELKADNDSLRAETRNLRSEFEAYKSAHP